MPKIKSIYIQDSLAMKTIYSFFEKLNPAACWIVVALFVLNLFAQGLAEGGRWDLYEAVAMADRWGSGFGYSNGPVDFFKPSTPYFPGVTILALLFSPLGTYQIDALLFIAAALVVALFCVLHLVYKKYDGVWPLHVFLVFCTAVSSYLLPEWLSYAKEFKPDTVALVFFVLGMFFYSKINSRWWRGLLLAVSFAVALTFKQQIVAPQMGFLIATLFSLRLLRDKIVDAIFVCAGIVLGLLSVFIIDGGFFFAIQSHIGRDLVFINDFGHMKLLLQILGSLAVCLVAFGKVNFSIACGRIYKNIFLILPAAAWLIACIAGAINFGGNIGNTAVGIILFLPFIAFFFERSKSIFILALACILTISLVKSLTLTDWGHRWQDRIKLDAEISDLGTATNSKSILISGDSYLAVRGAGIQRVSEIDTWAHIRLGVNRSKVPANGDALIRELNPDLIVCVQGCKVFDSFYSFDPGKNGYKEIPVKAVQRSGVLFVKSPQGG